MEIVRDGERFEVELNAAGDILEIERDDDGDDDDGEGNDDDDEGDDDDGDGDDDDGDGTAGLDR